MTEPLKISNTAQGVAELEQAREKLELMGDERDKGMDYNIERCGDILEILAANDSFCEKISPIAVGIVKGKPTVSFKIEGHCRDHYDIFETEIMSPEGVEVMGYFIDINLARVFPNTGITTVPPISGDFYRLIV